jgi:hypothetical protein
MKIFYLLAGFILILGCNNPASISDPFSSIKGLIVDGGNETPLDSVLVGFKSPDLPDSVLFMGDSILINSSSFTNPVLYTSNGYFEFGFAFASKPPVDYTQMFAYKPGKKLWRFNPNSDTVYHLISNIDSLKIKLY